MYVNKHVCYGAVMFAYMMVRIPVIVKEQPECCKIHYGWLLFLSGRVGREGIFLYRLYRYVQRNRLWFLRFSVFK